MEIETRNTNVTDNNLVTVSGEIISKGEFNHEVYGEKFYLYYLSVQRLSDSSDTIPLIVSERLVDLENLQIGTKVSVVGQFRSYNRHEDNKNRLILSVFVREMYWQEEGTHDDNKIELSGFVCKAPIYRKTPLGREICDLLIAVNRPYGKSDYIPCICWGRNARFANSLKVGDEITTYGRIQSRTYLKKIDGNPDNTEERTAYEVSVSKIFVVSESE